MILAHLSDIHIGGSPQSAERALRVRDYVNGMPGGVDAVVVTGDIADHALTEEYETAREALRYDAPTLVCPGNHDARAAFRAVLLDGAGAAPPGASSHTRAGAAVNAPPDAPVNAPPDDPVNTRPDAPVNTRPDAPVNTRPDAPVNTRPDAPVNTRPDDPVNQVLRLDGLTVVLCDSSIPGRDDGYLDDATVAWLDEVLAGADGPVLVGMHHPPVPLGLPLVDAIRLRRPERLENVLRRHPQVVAVLAGHAHTAASAVFAGLPLSVAPGVVSTLKLPREARVPEEWIKGDVLDRDAPPAFTLHVLDGRTLVSHTRVLY